MTEKTSNEEFREKLNDLPTFVELKDIVKDYFHRYFQQKIKSKNQNKQLSAKKAAKKERKVIFKIFKQLKDTLKTKYSIEEHMEKIQKGMRESGLAISHESIFKYYLAFLEGYEEDQKKDGSKSKSRSNSNSSVESKKKRKKNGDQIEPKTRKFILPSNIQTIEKEANQIEEQGEIKDDEIDEKEKKKKPKSSKKKRRSSSSDSD